MIAQHFHTDTDVWSKIYIFLFFLMGLAWMIPGRWVYYVSVTAIMVYAIRHTSSHGHKISDNGFLFFFITLTVFLIHSALTNLIELLRFSYVPFHEIYLLGSGGLKSVLRLIFYFSLIYVLFRFFQKKEKRFFLQAFAWGANIILTILVCYLPTLVSVSLTTASGGRIFLFEGENTMHANTISSIMMLYFYVNLLSLFYSKKLFNKVCHILFCALSFVVMLLTMSRGPLLALVTGLACVICMDKKRFIAVVIVTALMFLYSNAFDKNFFSFLPKRFTVSQAIEDKGSGRTSVWGDYLKFATLKDVLIGNGLASRDQAILYQKPVRAIDSRILYHQRASLQRLFYTHNICLQILFTFGALGFLFICYVVCKASSRLLTGVLRGKIISVYLALWISFWLKSMFDGGLFSTECFVIVAIILSQIYTKEENINEA